MTGLSSPRNVEADRPDISALDVSGSTPHRPPIACFALDAQLVDLRNKRDEVYSELWDKIKRVRNSVKGIYGDDSSEYEMVGGTRRSGRKPPVRRLAPAINGQ